MLMQLIERGGSTNGKRSATALAEVTHINPHVPEVSLHGVRYTGFLLKCERGVWKRRTKNPVVWNGESVLQEWRGNAPSNKEIADAKKLRPQQWEFVS